MVGGAYYLKVMLHRLLSLMAAALFACGLLFTTTSCTSKSRQLDAAIAAINKQFPQTIAEGAILEGFFPDGQNIDIAVTLQTDSMTDSITTQRLAELKEDLVDIFTQVAHSDKSLHDFFTLIRDNQRTLSLTITTLPDHTPHRIAINQQGIQRIIDAPKHSSEEMTVMQLDKNLASQQSTLPLPIGPLVCSSIRREGKLVIWEFEADEEKFDFEALASDPAGAKENILRAQADPQAITNNRLIIDAGCGIRYHYIATKSGRTFDIDITRDELRRIQKDAISTKID